MTSPCISPESTDPDDLAVIATTHLIVVVIPMMIGVHEFAISSFVGDSEVDQEPWQV